MVDSANDDGGQRWEGLLPSTTSGETMGSIVNLFQNVDHFSKMDEAIMLSIKHSTGTKAGYLQTEP
jgi:hypothetical protein